LSLSASPIYKSCDDEKPRGDSITLTATKTTDTFVIDGKTPSGDPVLPELSKASTTRKILLLLMFTLAKFLDAFTNSTLSPAIPIISEQLSFNPSETVWLVSAYQLTFAAFLLVSSDSFPNFGFCDELITMVVLSRAAVSLMVRIVDPS
jgi:hypothetical protein